MRDYRLSLADIFARLVWKTVTDRDLVPSVQPMIAQILKDIAEEDALEPVEKET